jgi:prepilin-type N-terminal cleavage/methylation domain-containing protein
MLKENKGYTLIELLASITILTFIIAALIPIFINIAKWTNQSENELVATNLLQQVASDLKKNPQGIADQNITSCQDKFTEIPGYDSYNINGQEYYVNLRVCMENQVNLYRTNVRVYSNDHQLKSESFTYVPVGGNP